MTEGNWRRKREYTVWFSAEVEDGVEEGRQKVGRQESERETEGVIDIKVYRQRGFSWQVL